MFAKDTSDKRLPLLPRLDAGWAFLILVFLAAQFYYGWVAASQQWSHHTFPADVGLMHDSLYWTLHGKFMYSPLIEKSHFAVHFTPTLFLILPLYMLFETPATLLLFQSVFLVSAAVPLYLITRHLTNHRGMAFAVAAIYLTNYFVASIHQSSHYEAMLPFFIFTALCCVLTRRRRLYWLFLVLALGVKTDVPIYMFFMGAYLWLVHSEKRLGIATMLLSAIWFVVAVLTVRAFAADVGLPGYATAWDDVKSIPWMMLKALWWPRLILLFSTVGFLFLFDWRSALLILPPALLLMTSSSEDFRYLRYYRSVTILPFLFFSAAMGLRRLRSFAKLRPWMIHLLLLAVLVHGGRMWLMRPTLANGLRMRPFPVARHHAAPWQMAELVPRDASLAVQWDLYCQVPRRPRLLLLEDYRKADYILVDSRGNWGIHGDDLKSELVPLFDKELQVVAVAHDRYILAQWASEASHP